MKHLLPLAALLLLGGAVKLDEATYSIGQKYYQQGLYTEAEKRFLEIVRKFPDSAKFRESLFMLGKTYAQLGNDKAALQYYKLLLNKAQSVSEKQGALLGIAKSWLQLGVHDKAAEFYSFYAAEYPESTYAPAALYYAGLSREREGKTPEAVEKYRRVFELYPSSDFQARAIEKVAVLDQNTPESLWREPVRTARKPQGLFPEEENTEAVPGYKAPPPRAQGYSYELQEYTPQAADRAPAVVTQMIQAPPVILTQQIQSPPVILTQTIQTPPIVVTQTIITPVSAPLPMEAPAPMVRPLPTEIQAMMSNKVVVLSNGQMVSSQTDPAEAAKIAEYRRQWEAERLQKEKEQKLNNASQAVDRMLDLADNKGRLLQAKEAALLEKQNALRLEVYQGLNGIKVTAPKPYRGAPNTNQTTNQATAPAVAAEPPAAPEMPPAAEVPADNLYPDEANAEDLYYEEAYAAEEYALDADIDNEAAVEDAPLLDQ